MRDQASVNCTKQPENMMELKTCKPLESPCLFNIRDDPCEQFNLADRYDTVIGKCRRIYFNC